MAKPAQKITLNASRDIPFDCLVLSQDNVRRVKAGVLIGELAEDIARRSLLQSLAVRPLLDEAGAETGKFAVPAGGRRFRALELLVKQKRLAKNALVPCIVKLDDDVPAVEDSYAENDFREPLLGNIDETVLSVMTGVRPTAALTQRAGGGRPDPRIAQRCLPTLRTTAGLSTAR